MNYLYISWLEIVVSQYLQCVHALWNREITFDLSKKLAKAKRFGIDEEEGFQEIEMRQWLQDIREIGYVPCLLRYSCRFYLLCFPLLYVFHGYKSFWHFILSCDKWYFSSENVLNCSRHTRARFVHGIGRYVLIFPCFRWSQLQFSGTMIFGFYHLLKHIFCFMQFEDEFRRYLPVYFEMMQEVDTMVGCFEVIFPWATIMQCKECLLYVYLKSTTECLSVQ